MPQGLPRQQDRHLRSVCIPVCQRTCVKNGSAVCQAQCGPCRTKQSELPHHRFPQFRWHQRVAVPEIGHYERSDAIPHEVQKLRARGPETAANYDAFRHEQVDGSCQRFRQLPGRAFKPLAGEGVSGLPGSYDALASDRLICRLALREGGAAPFPSAGNPALRSLRAGTRRTPARSP